MARNEFINTPLQLRKRRKSSIPFQLVEFLRNNDLSQINPLTSTKNSLKGKISSKKNLFINAIKNRIPEVSEISSSQKREEKFKKEKNKKEKIKNEKKKKR